MKTKNKPKIEDYLRRKAKPARVVIIARVSPEVREAIRRAAKRLAISMARAVEDGMRFWAGEINKQ